jgi:hypothetical protein
MVLLTRLTAGAAQAGVPSNSGIFAQFNAVIFGNFGAGSEVEGLIVVGGDLDRRQRFSDP